MKTMRDHLFTLGAVCVLALGVVLAQDQAPQAPAPNAPPAPEAAAAPAVPAPQMPVPNAPPVQEAAAVPAPQMQGPAAISSRRPMVMPGRTMPTARPAFPSRSMSPSTASTLPAPTASSGVSSQLPASGEPRSKTTTPALKFDNAAIDIILMAYAQETGKTLLNAPDVPKANITLKSQADTQLTKEEYLEAIEAVLGMNGIVLEPFGDKFVKVLARKTVRTEGIKILMENPEGGHPEKGQVISQMIQLKSITFSEAQKALEGFKKPDGLIMTFERTNSLLVTDTQENVNRMMEIVRFIDQPLIATEEVNVRIIRFAKADDIKKRLEELVAESQKQTQAKEEVKANVSGSPGFTRSTTPVSPLTRPLPPGLSRLATPQPVVSTPNASLETLVSDADRGMIRGKVQIISDERSNQLIIITRKENMNFFEKIINVLDIETAPDVKIEVQRLEFADAEEVSTMLNDLIGNATSKKDDKAPGAAAKGTTYDKPGEAAKSTTLAEAVAARTSRPETPAGAGSESGKSKLGALSKDNIKILADKRTNALVMMGSPNDLLAIKEIIAGMDIQLDQVLIETVVLQVTLKNEISTGIDWVKRIDFDKQNYRYNLSGGGGRNTPTDLSILENVVSNAVTASAKSGLQYFATLKDLNLDAVISASKSDNAAKVLSSPILLTVDNKEATIEATEMKYMYKGMRYMGGYGNTSGGYGGGNYEPDIEQRDVGLTIKITPRISPNGNVILTVDEKFEDVLGSQTIASAGVSQEWPTVTTRKLTADVSVGSGETVILGGLVKTGKTDDSSGIPILKDIPYVGKYLFGKVGVSDERSEMLVFLTPYVIKNADDMSRETRRRKEYINADGVWTKGWSDSQLADPVSEADMKKRLERTKALENAWMKYRAGLGEKQEMDAKLEEQRALAQAMMMPPGAAASETPRVGRMNATETVEVLKPEGADAEALPQRETEPVPPALKEPKKPWWKF